MSEGSFMSEDVELRRSVIKMIRAVLALHAAVAEMAPADASVQDHLQEASRAIDEALERFEVGVDEPAELPTE